MAKAQALQANGHFTEALALFRSIYTRYSESFDEKKTSGLALCRHLQLMGGTDDMRTALDIYTWLHTHMRNDIEIELALGKHIQLMGSTDNLIAALDTFTQQRTEAAEGRTRPPRNSTEVGLARCRHLQLMGGTENLKMALRVYEELRTDTNGGRIHAPSPDTRVELGIATTLIGMGAWREFDELHLDTRPSLGFKAYLCICRRNLQELAETEGVGPERLALLKKALHWATLAVEKSGEKSAPCLYQLGHCFRLLSTWPKSELQSSGIEEKKENEFREQSALFFAKANKLIPYQHERQTGALRR
ncbi:hypothetical protein E1189_13855 [Sansalvadorimonas verongulae]|nr:hypothetical protein [Sansalvadorimonas verongulae]